MCVRVCRDIGCVYLVRGVRQISWCVTGAIKVVALDTAHERRNDSELMLISLLLAPSSEHWPVPLPVRGSLGARRRNRDDAERGESVPALRLLAEAGKPARERKGEI